MDVITLKTQFAMALKLEPNNYFKAACVVFPNDIGLAAKYAFEWKDDSEVLSILNTPVVKPIIEHEYELTIPNKDDALHLAWNIANNSLEDGKNRVAALKLFAEIQNYMPDKTINKNVNMSGTVNRVMIIKDHGNDQEWEQKLLASQKALVNDN